MEKINYRQMFIILFIFRIFRMMTYNPVAHFNSVYVIVSVILSAFVQFVFLIPVFYLYKHYDKKGISEASFDVSKPFGVIISLIYSSFFILSTLKLVKYLAIFMREYFFEISNKAFIVISIFAVASYAATLGIESLARSSVFIASLFFVMLILMTITCKNNFDILNFNLIDNNDMSLKGLVIREIGMNVDIVVLPLILPHIKDRIVSCAVWLCAFKSVVISLTVFLYTCFLGSYVSFVLHPFFTLGEFSTTKLVERFNGIYMFVWVLCAVIVIAVNIYTSAYCLKNIFIKRKFKAFVIGVSLLCIAVSLMTRLDKTVVDYATDNYVTFISVFVLTFVIPLLVILILKIKNSSFSGKFKKSIRTTGLIFALLLTLSLFTGCSLSSVGVNELAIVELVGVDKENDKLKVTLQIFAPDGDVTEIAGNSNIDIVDSIGDTVAGCLQDIEHKVGKKLFFGHNKIIILGNKMVESDLFINLSYFSDDVMVHPGTDVVVAEKSAAEIVNIKLKTGLITSKSMFEVLEKADEDSLVKRVLLSDVISQLSSDNNVIALPLVNTVISDESSDKEEKDEQDTLTDKKMLKINKDIIINKNGIVTTLDSRETTGLKWLSNNVKTLFLTVNKDGRDYCLRVFNTKTTLKSFNKDNKVVVKVAIKGDITPLYVDISLMHEDRSDNKRIIKRLAVDEISGQINACFDKSKEYSCDIPNLKKLVKFYNKDYYESIINNKENLIESMSLDVNVELNIII